MKAILLLSLLLALGLAAGCTTGPIGAAPHETRPHYVVGVDADFSPFTSLGDDGNFSGFDIDAARAVAEREGINVTFVAVPWDAAIDRLEDGQVDIVWSGTTVSPERSAKVNFSRPYYFVEQSIAVRAGSGFTVQDLLSGRLRIGAQAGSTEAEWVSTNLIAPGILPAENLTLCPDVGTLTAALVNGSVDATLVQAPAQADAIEGRPLVIIGTTGTQDAYAVAVRKTDPALLATVDHGLARLMEDPAWQEMKARYGLA